MAVAVHTPIIIDTLSRVFCSYCRQPLKTKVDMHRQCCGTCFMWFSIIERRINLSDEHELEVLMRMESRYNLRFRLANAISSDTASLLLTKNNFVDGIGINGAFLGTFPEEINAFKQLSKVRVVNGGIYHVASGLLDYYPLGGVRELTLRGNKIPLEELEQFLCNFPNLEYLDLSKNQLGTIPHSVTKLARLRSLVLENNALEEIPEDLNLPYKLEHLGLSGNLLTSLPSGLEEHESLETIDLSHNPVKFDVKNKFHGLVEVQLSKEGVVMTPHLDLTQDRPYRFRRTNRMNVHSLLSNGLDQDVSASCFNLHHYYGWEHRLGIRSAKQNKHHNSTATKLLYRRLIQKRRKEKGY